MPLGNPADQLERPEGIESLAAILAEFNQSSKAFLAISWYPITTSFGAVILILPPHWNTQL